MSDDFDIDKFLNESFSKLDKKFEKKNTSKKVEKVLNKFNRISDSNINNETQLQNERKMNINLNLKGYNFDKTIDNKIFQEISFPGASKNSNINLDNILKPLFPNEKVYQNEFRNSDKNFILDKFVGNSKKSKEEENIDKLLNTNKNNPFLKNNKFKKTKESDLIALIKNDPTICYSSLISMNDLWNDYISNLLNKTTSPETIFNKMVKADLHGAIIEVVDAKNKNLISLIGINLLETRRTFNILAKDDKLKTILKKGTVFKLLLPYEDKKISLKILGDNFTYKAVERTKAKFKNKYHL